MMQFDFYRKFKAKQKCVVKLGKALAKCTVDAKEEEKKNMTPVIFLGLTAVTHSALE